MSSNVVLQVQSNVIINFSNDDVIVTLSVADRYCFLSVMDHSSRASTYFLPALPQNAYFSSGYCVAAVKSGSPLLSLR